MDIRTEYLPKPIPWRISDWEAYDQDGNEDSPVGFGATEADAIENLLEETPSKEEAKELKDFEGSRV